jgi:hypothetical protein
MNANKINEQIEKLEQALAKLKAEATAPSQYEIEYEAGSTNLIGSYRTMQGNSRTHTNLLNTGRYRSTKKFANEHLQTQTEMMRLGALVEAVTIELGMVSWVADWNEGRQYKHYVFYDHEDNTYGLVWCQEVRIAGVIYMPQKVAERVCEILNNKEYELSGVNYGDRT